MTTGWMSTSAPSASRNRCSRWLPSPSVVIAQNSPMIDTLGFGRSRFTATRLSRRRHRTSAATTLPRRLSVSRSRVLALLERRVGVAGIDFVRTNAVTREVQAVACHHRLQRRFEELGR